MTKQPSHRILQESTGPCILQLNVEGLTRSKCEVIERLATKHSAQVLLLQETHTKEDKEIKIYGYHLAASIHSQHHGIATLVKNGHTYSILDSSHSSDQQWIAVSIGDTTVVNVYKPPKTSFSNLPIYDHPVIYSGDFNCQNEQWGYKNTTPDGEALANWASTTNLTLLYDSKQPCSFTSGRWQTGTNPDLAFCSSRDRSTAQRTVISKFPRSQHRPSLITHPALVTPTTSMPQSRWNFKKANWDTFREELNKHPLPDLAEQDQDTTYKHFSNSIINAAKASIPRGHRRVYVPGWDEECETYALLHDNATSYEESQEAATALLNHLDNRRREKWIEETENINFTHSSRQAWSKLNRLTGNVKPFTSQAPVKANDIANNLINNGKFNKPNKEFTFKINRHLKDAWNTPSADQDLCSDFSMAEVKSAIATLKQNKAPGPDSLHPEFFQHLPESTLLWLKNIFNMCLRTVKIPKIWRTAKIVAILKPNKPAEDPKSYRPISLLCVSFKLLERLILNRIYDTVDENLPKEQAGFRKGYSTTDQVARLTEDITTAFQRKEKAGAVFVDLSAAYDTIWHRGLALKLLQTIPSKHMVKLIMQMMTNRSFTLHIDHQKTKKKMLKNGVPQGSVLAPICFNIYTSDLPTTTSKKYTYADDIALLTTGTSFSSLSDTLTNDLTNLNKYFINWRLKMNETKTVSSNFHLANRLANTQLKVKCAGNTIPFEKSPKYLGVTLDRSLTYKQHLQQVRAKVEARNCLIHRLCGTSWGASFPVLRTATLALAYSTAEYCAPIWCKSTHTTKLDIALNNSMRMVSGCIRSTPTSYLPILSGIPPPAIRREAACLSLAQRAQRRASHLLHHDINSNDPPPRLPLRAPISARLRGLLHEANGQPPGSWTITQWTKQWGSANTKLHGYIKTPSTRPAGHTLNRNSWVRLNRCRTGHGRFRANMHRMNLCDAPDCPCGAPEQTADHIINDCTKYQCPGLQALSTLNSEALAWLADTSLVI